MKLLAPNVVRTLFLWGVYNVYYGILLQLYPVFGLIKTKRNVPGWSTTCWEPVVRWDTMCPVTSRWYQKTWSCYARPTRREWAGLWKLKILVKKVYGQRNISVFLWRFWTKSTAPTNGFLDHVDRPSKQKHIINLCSEFEWEFIFIYLPSNGSCSPGILHWSPVPIRPTKMVWLA